MPTQRVTELGFDKKPPTAATIQSVAASKWLAQLEAARSWCYEIAIQPGDLTRGALTAYAKRPARAEGALLVTTGGQRVVLNL